MARKAQFTEDDDALLAELGVLMLRQQKASSPFGPVRNALLQVLRI